MSKNFIVKVFVAVIVWGVGLSLFGSIQIFDPTADPKVEINRDESIIGWGVLDPDNGSVNVTIRRHADKDAPDEVHIEEDPTDGQGNWGNNYVPDKGVWKYENVDYSMTVKGGGAASAREFKVKEIPIP